MFMKAATQRRQARMVHAAGGLTTATVCRLSGQLATEGCEDVEVVEQRRPARTALDGLHRVLRARHRADGDLRSASDARDHGASSRQSFGAGDEQPAPPRIEDTGLAPAAGWRRRRRPRRRARLAAAGRSGSRRKKRGFWSRIFGRDNDEADHGATAEQEKGAG